MGHPRKEEITITEPKDSLLSAVSHCSGNEGERDLATSWAVSVRPGTLSLDLSEGRITPRCSHDFLLYPGATHSQGDKREPAHPPHPHVSDKTRDSVQKIDT